MQYGSARTNLLGIPNPQANALMIYILASLKQSQGISNSQVEPTANGIVSMPASNGLLPSIWKYSGKSKSGKPQLGQPHLSSIKPPDGPHTKGSNHGGKVVESIDGSYQRSIAFFEESWWNYG